MLFSFTTFQTSLIYRYVIVCFRFIDIKADKRKKNETGLTIFRPNNNFTNTTLIHHSIFNTLDAAFKLCPLTYSNTVFVILSFYGKRSLFNSIICHSIHSVAILSQGRLVSKLVCQTKKLQREFCRCLPNLQLLAGSTPASLLDADLLWQLYKRQWRNCRRMDWVFLKWLKS